MDVRIPEKRYIRIGSDSGCFLANYKPLTDQENTIVIVRQEDERSGRFRTIRK